MPTPKQVIEQIRKTRFAIGLDTSTAATDVQAHIRDSATFRDDASRLVAEIHAEKPHFILELTQNAEDNDYDENVKPMIKFIIEDDRLVLQNNERGFRESNAWALCGIGETTKQDKHRGYIGEKGIGFKSVFMITDEPHVYSNGFQFKFKYDPETPITIIIPEWVDQVPKCVDLGQTNIVLPLKDEAKRDIAKLSRIDPGLLLFLRKLRTIDVEDTVENRQETIERNDVQGKVEIIHSGGKDIWRIVKNHQPIGVPKHVKEEKRRDVLETEVVLAFPLKSDGSSPDTSTPQRVFAYLPIRSYGFKFIIQADFLMPPSREDVYKDNSWNAWLRDNIASVFLTAVEGFKQDETLKKTYYNYIPLSDEITDLFFHPVAEQIHTALRDASCIMTESGNWAKPARVLIADDKVRKLISNDELQVFFSGSEYISSAIEAEPEILSALEVQTFRLDHLLQCIQQTEWLKEHNDEWFSELYLYLKTQKLNKEHLKLLNKSNIIRLENGQLASVSERSIFLPLGRKGAYGFEKELSIVKRALLQQKDKGRRETLTQFLKKLGVRSASPYEIIENHILPVYESEDDMANWRSKDDKTLLGYIRYIRDNLGKYEEECQQGLKSKEKSPGAEADPLDRLRKSLLLRTDKTIDGTDYDHPESIYLPKAYGNQNDLETLFQGIEGIRFVHRDYIDSTAKKRSRRKRKTDEGASETRKQRMDEAGRWKDFLARIGVEDKPRVVLDPETIAESSEYVTGLLHIWDKRNPDWGDSTKGYYVEDDYVCPDLEKVFADLQHKRIGTLIKILENNRNWSYYKPRLECTYLYRRPRSSRWHGAQSESSFARLLLNRAWLPTTGGTLAKPREVFLANARTKALLGDSVSYLAADLKNEDFIKSLGINREASVDGVLNHLTSLTEMGCSDKETFATLYAFLERNSYEDTEGRATGAFSEQRIIYIPDTPQRYFKSGEVLWKDVSDVFGEHRGYLQKHYPKLRSFFVEELGVSEEPTPKDYADVLLDLSRREAPGTRDGRIALGIYRELNGFLDREKTEIPISEEDWWDAFVREPIFWTDKGEFWNSDIFVNDNPELYRLFRGKPKVAFLELPKNYHPKLQYFLQEVRIPLLSDAVHIELADADHTTKLTRDDLSNLVRSLQAPISQYLYQEEIDAYERAKQDGILTQLRSLSVYEVKHLEVRYTLGPVSVVAPRSTVLHEGHLYVESESLEDTDSLAVELARLFGELKGLDSFLVSLFDKKTEDKIENLLRAKGIQALPDDEKAWLEQADTTARERITAKTQPQGVPEAEAPPVPVPPDRDGRPQIREIAVPMAVLEPSVSEEVGWQAECRPEEPQVRIEKFQPPETRQPAHAGARVGTSEAIPIALDEEHGPRDGLSREDKWIIGRWGERCAVGCLEREMKEKYPEAVLEDTPEGFQVRLHGTILARVHWLNKSGDIGTGCDIEVSEHGTEDYIEVKSTITDQKEWFDVTEAQWRLAQQKGHRFHIYLVRRAGSAHPELQDIEDPTELWRQGLLQAQPVRIRL